LRRCGSITNSLVTNISKGFFNMMSEQNKDTAQIVQFDEKPHNIDMYFDAVFNNSKDPIFVKDEESRFVLVNDAFCSIFGLFRNQIIGQTLAKKLPSSELENFLSTDKYVLEKGTEVLSEELLTPTGVQTKTVTIRKNRFIDGKGKYFLVGVIHDLTETRQLEQEKEDAEEEKGKRADELILANHELSIQNKENKYLLKKLKRAASVFTSAHESIMITDHTGNIVEVNAAFFRITGYASEEVLGRNPSFLQSGGEPPEFYTQMWDGLQLKGHWRGEIWSRRKNGEIYPEMMTISAVKSTTGNLQHFVYLGTDITELKAYQKQLEKSAHFDMLTNLPNRVLLADRLGQAMVHCQRANRSLAVAFMDLDGFKEINDKHGHDVGDELLIAVSKRMTAALRGGDTLARIGGDEFIAVMVDLEKSEDSAPVLERLLKAAAAPVNLDDTVLKVSASIGVSICPEDGTDADQLMRHADQAMYVAKQAGKDRYRLFDNELANAVKIQLKGIHDIRSALDRCEFVLHYQPKVNMHTGEVIGVEALIRWQHIERGLVLPLDCLPIIEDKPISLELGEWVIDNALAQISQWQNMSINLPISVNISAYQLQQDNFTTRLAVLLSAHPDVDPSYLELEMLETSVLEDISKVSATMSACHELGVCFALDDFGTGYSSLTHLRRLPAKLIKIDQSFVRDMLEDPEDCAIVEGIIGLAKAFRRDVIAEGVETIAHGVALLQRGCEMAQGYGIARPMLADDIPRWLSNWKTEDSWSV
jgi:diguanylate cyclase (GGDEF)-like protein/PAS domain S-box-containing protein